MDTTEFEGLVADLQRAQQQEDVDAFVGLFHPDAVWVTAHGMRLIGRDAIAEFTARVLPGAMRESTAVYEVEHVVRVRPDVAVVAVRQRPVTLDGEPIADQPEGRPTYVVARDADAAGAWRIVSGQNTQVRE